MAKQNRFSLLITPYRWKLLLVVLVNILAIIFSILTLMLVEPFLKLIFQGEFSGLSPIGEGLISIVGGFADLSSLQSSLLGLVLFVVALFFFKNLFLFLAQWIMAPIRSDVVRKLRNDLYDKILILPLSYFNEQKKGDVISRAVNDAQEVEFTILRSLQQLFKEPISVLLYVIALFVLSYKLTFFVMILLPVTGFIIGRISKTLRKKSLDAKTKMGELLAHVEETLSGLRVIKGFNAQEHAESVFESKNADFSDVQQKIYRRIDMASPVSEFLGITVVMIVLIVGGMMVLGENSTLTPGLFITYIALFSQIVNPAKTISTAYYNYRRGLSALDRIYEVLDAEEVIEEAKNAVPVSSFNTSISFEDVTFSYQQAEVLKKISFTIEKGQIVALVGQSGAGKSTIADLLPRFYDVNSGAIKLDGRNIKEYKIDDLRSLYAIVSQDIVLFHGTIFNNIAFGLKDVSEEEVIKAAKIANAYDFIAELPEGLYTNIGDRGLTLSGGQRQRISIARAVLRNAPVLILDEATSAMDTESEKLVQNALDNVMLNRTSLVIAHRLSTIKHADKIIVLEDGRIVESGTHQDLMDLSGKYSKLVKMQYYQ